MRKTMKRVLTTVLTLAMMIGVFVGGGVQVKAAPTYELVAVGDDVNYEGAKALVADNPSSQAEREQDSEFIQIIKNLISEEGLSGKLIVFYNISTNGTINSLFMDPKSTGWSTMSGDVQYSSMKKSLGYVYYYLVIHEDTSQTPNPNPGKGGNASKTSSSKSVKSEEPVHEHSYSWVTVQEAGVGQDGIEEYRCSCGAVADRSVIPATQAAVSGMMDAIQNAPAGGNISFDSGRFYTMSDKIIQKLAERNDVVTEITFEYQGTAYKMTVPAGIDYTAILADEESFYGYFYFAQLIGATIETR